MGAEYADLDWWSERMHFRMVYKEFAEKFTRSWNEKVKFQKAKDETGDANAIVGPKSKASAKVRAKAKAKELSAVEDLENGDYRYGSKTGESQAL